MQKKSIIVAIYAALVLSGGLIGYLVANSVASLVAGCCSALLLFCCSFFLRKNYAIAYNITLGILACLLAFFSFRFSLSYQLVPAGMMTVITGGVLTYLFISKNYHGLNSSKESISD